MENDGRSAHPKNSSGISVALADNRHFGKAAKACLRHPIHPIGQPQGAGGRLAGAAWSTRTNRRLAFHAAGRGDGRAAARRLLDQAQGAGAGRPGASGRRSPGTIRLGVIPTIGPFPAAAHPARAARGLAEN